MNKEGAGTKSRDVSPGATVSMMKDRSLSANSISPIPVSANVSAPRRVRDKSPAPEPMSGRAVDYRLQSDPLPNMGGSDKSAMQSQRLPASAGYSHVVHGGSVSSQYAPGLSQADVSTNMFQNEVAINEKLRLAEQRMAACEQRMYEEGQKAVCERDEAIGMLQSQRNQVVRNNDVARVAANKSRGEVSDVERRQMKVEGHAYDLGRDLSAEQSNVKRLSNQLAEERNAMLRSQRETMEQLANTQQQASDEHRPQSEHITRLQMDQASIERDRVATEIKDKGKISSLELKAASYETISTDRK